MMMHLALVLFSTKAAAQGVSVPDSKNPELRKIARLYDDLEYEKALELVAKAERHPSNGAQERQWLDLMQGVLHFSLHETEKADAFFLRALKRFVYSPLPLFNPSQTLYEYFESLRATVLRPAKAPEVVAATEAPKPQPAAEEGEAVSAPVQSRMELLNKLNALEAQERTSAGGTLPSEISAMFGYIRRLNQDARTPAAKRAVSQCLRALEELIRSSRQVAVPRQRSAEKPHKESSGEPSSASLLSRLGSLEARARQLAKGSEPSTLTVFLEPLRFLITEAHSLEARRSVSAWLGTMEKLMNGERGIVVPEGATDQRQVGSLSTISLAVQFTRMIHLAEWFYAQAGGKEVHPDLLDGLEESCYALMAEGNSHGRMTAAGKMDELQRQMEQRFGMRAPRNVDSLWLVRHPEELEQKE